MSFGVPLPRIFALDEDGVAEYVIEKDTWRRVCPAWPLQGTLSVSALVPVDSDGFVAFVPIAASPQRAKSSGFVRSCTREDSRPASFSLEVVQYRIVGDGARRLPPLPAGPPEARLLITKSLR